MTASEVERLVIRHVSEVTAAGGDWRAAIDDVPPGTVRSRISRGRALLVEQLGVDPEPGNREPTPVRQNDDG